MAGNGAAVALAVSVTTALVKALFNAVVFDVNRFMRCAVLTRRPGLQLTAPIMVVGNAITDGAHDELHSEGPQPVIAIQIVAGQRFPEALPRRLQTVLECGTVILDAASNLDQAFLKAFDQPLFASGIAGLSQSNDVARFVGVEMIGPAQIR